MVQRNSQPVNFTQQDNAEYTQAGGGYVSADSQMKRTVGDGGASANSALIQSILGQVKGVFDTGVQTSREEAYLNGSAQAASGIEEEALESSFMTRDWATAGYRDTAGKLKMAQAEAELPKDMQTLRQESPEKMAEYLAERRAKLAPSLDGMSRQQRTAALGQMILSDRNAIATHAKEHTDFQVETLVATKQAAYSVEKANLDAALRSGNEAQYTTARTKFLQGFIGGAILGEPRLDGRTKQSLAVEGLVGALKDGHTLVYEQLANEHIPDDITKPDGPRHTVLSTFSMENQVKLSNAYRSARDATVGARTLDLHNRIALVQSQQSDGTWQGTFADVQALQNEVLADDKGNTALAGSLAKHYYATQGKATSNSPTVHANVMLGNENANRALGVDPSEALAGTMKSWVKEGLPFPQQVANLVRIAPGSEVGAKALGGILDTSMRQLDLSGKMAPENVAAMSKMIAQVEALQKDNNPTAIQNMYAGMKPENATRLERLIDLGASSTPDIAMMKLQEIEQREMNKTPAVKAAEERALSKEVLAYRANIEPHGVVSQFLSHMPLVGRSTAQNDLSVKTALFLNNNTNSDLNKHATDSVYSAIQEEADLAIRRNPTSTVKSIMGTAESQVLARTIQVDGVPLVVAKGYKPLEFFAVGDAKFTASPEQLSRAISMVANKSNPDNVMMYTVAGKNVLAQEYTQDGQFTGLKKMVSPEEVRRAVAMQIDKGVKATDEAYGFGAVIPVNGTSLRINGDNTAAMANQSMVSLRKNLSKYEGFIKGVQPDVGKQVDADGKPIMTTGIGISSKNTYFKEATEATSPEQHLEVFRKATDEAARFGIKLNKVLGLRGENWQILTSELMYQSGSGTIQKKPEYQEFFRIASTPAAPYSSTVTPHLTPAMYAQVQKETRYNQALVAFKKTPAYTMSGAPRQRHYIAMLKQSIDGEY